MRLAVTGGITIASADREFIILSKGGVEFNRRHPSNRRRFTIAASQHIALESFAVEADDGEPEF